MPDRVLKLCVCPSPATTSCHASRRSNAVLDVEVFARPVRVSVDVPHCPIHLADIVPVARAVADHIVDLTVSQNRAEGKEVPCRRGCASCCRYLVPVSAPEAFRLNEELACKPGGAPGQLAGPFLAATQRILNAERPNIPAATMTLPDGRTISPAGAAGHWYAGLDIPCPLLDDAACRMYEQRPIACREHMVTSPPEACRDFHPDRGRLAAVPFSIQDALAVTTAELEDGLPEAVILPLVPAWCDSNAARAERTWPAEEVVERFFAVLRHLAAEAAGRDDQVADAA